MTRAQRGRDGWVLTTVPWGAPGALCLERSPAVALIPAPSWRRLIGLVAAGLIAGVGLLWAWTVSHPAAVQRSLSSPARLSLPSAALAPISDALAADVGGYQIVGLRAQNPAQRLALTFSRTGVRVVSGPALLRLGRVALGDSGKLRVEPPATPRVLANRVTYSWPGLVEWYANGPLGLEQGFEVSGAATRGGWFTIRVPLQGTVSARLRRGALVLSARGVRLRYGSLVASDARGHRLPARLALAPHQVMLRIDARGARYPLRIDPFIRQAQLTGSDGYPGDNCCSVAVSGNTIVAGSPLHQVGSNPQQGSVYVFTKPPTGWKDATQTAELTASDGAENDQLGASVAIDGNTIVAGAPYHTVGSTLYQGAVYVFTEPVSGWHDATQSAELTGSDGEREDYMGSSVAISGDTIVAGAPYHVLPSYGFAGEAYVFTKPSPGWKDGHETAQLTSPNPQQNSQFGEAVGVSGSTIVVGQDTETVSNNSFQGAAYVYTKPPAGWQTTSLAAQLTASDGAQNDRLGYTVAIDGNTVAVGAPEFSVSGGTGAVYVYTEPPSGWQTATENAELVPAGAPPGDLASALSISGDTIVAGDPNLTVDSQAYAGAVFVFKPASSGWQQASQEEITAPTATAKEFFGNASGVAGPVIAADDPMAQVGTDPQQGVVDVFSPTPPTITLGRPGNGAAYRLHQQVRASYSCGPPAGTTITSCTGTVVNGAAIPTTTAGRHRFTVTAIDSDGAVATRTVAYTVAQPPTGILSVGRVKVDRSVAKAPLTCRGVAGSTCVAALAARATTNRVVVGAKTVTLRGGGHETVALSLNASGRRMLAARRTLAAQLTITTRRANRTVVVFSHTITFKSNPRKRK